MNSIPVYAINLKNRVDRLNHVKAEFEEKNEFELNIVEAIKHPVGAIGLWQTLQYIFSLDKVKDSKYIIICEDDHVFTEHYSEKYFFECIEIASQNEADILIGGPSWVSSTFPQSDAVFWVEEFTGLQFVVVFSNFFDTIINSGSNELNIGADFRISRLSSKKYFIYPFVSIQKDFGYSDVTVQNDVSGRVDKLYKECTERLMLNEIVRDFFRKNPISTINIEDYLNIVIPTYVVNLPCRTDRRKHIERQFYKKGEFDVKIVEACKEDVGALGLWKSIRKIIQMAIDNGDDVIVICEDDHEFSSEYSKDFFITNVIEAAQQGADYLSGGSGGFSSAFPLTKNRYWVSTLLSTQFIVVYSKFYRRIMNEPFGDDIIADIRLSELSSNKMLLYPFISFQKDFGYSDVTALHNSFTGVVSNLFAKTQMRLSIIQKAYYEYT